MCSHLKRHGPLTARTFLLTMLATLALLVGSAGHAHADPTPAEVEAMLDAKWDEIRPVIEEHNGVKIKLDQERKKADALAAQLGPLEKEVLSARGKAGVYADYMYRGGQAAGISAMLESGDPTIIADRLQSMDQVSRHFNTRITEVLAAKTKLDEAKKPLDALVAQLDVLQKEQAARIKTIEAEIKKLDELRIKAYGNGNGIGNLAPVPCPTTYPGGKHGTAIKFACAQIGKMYKFATAGPTTYDCSGLTKAAWDAAGVDLPHQSAAQRSATTKISRSDLMPGDLVFYYSPISHVALYAGKINGVDWIVHANRAGNPVHMRKM
ncbi:MAG TPA: glycoside hydrolase, partial [Micromonosporaceae bacterium]|nr:glycoside hydrolase [Micromonosporaceae bacterium]